MRWVIDANNVMGSRPDGWWNDRDGAARRLVGEVADWCRDLDDHVVMVFDPPLDASVVESAGGNLEIVVAPRRRPDAADDRIVELVDDALGGRGDPLTVGGLRVVTSDRGLRRRITGRAGALSIEGAGRFADRLGRGGPPRRTRGGATGRMGR
ncbi:RNA-binding protein [Ilumatobacter sp.]|uniref:RNA-binding protein n=1 Tax=Ilumatobacter sp. TaxID=1967498 RepID=UPI003B523912